MSLVYNGLTYTLLCDGCMLANERIHHNPNVLRDLAKKHDWTRIRGTEKDYCPSCEVPSNASESGQRA